MTQDGPNLTAAVALGLETRLIGREIRYYPVVTSTMDAARRLTKEGAPDGAVVLAGEQTAGRGRRQRHWVSPPGNTALSIILYPPAASLPYLIMIAALAAARAIEAAAGVRTALKWPNDVLVEGKKVAGILVENEVKGRTAKSVIGIGVNTGLDAAAYPDIAVTAFSLNGAPATLLALLRTLLQEFDRLYAQLPDAQTIFENWRARLVTLGRPVRAAGAGRVIEGIALDVNPDGALVIREPSGALTTVVAGDVTLKETG